jgi:capsule polysaccharide export protein KpsE/RkpR
LIFKENFNFSQTKNESIILEVYDINPEKAQKFARGFIEEANLFIMNSVNKSINEKVKFITENYNEKIKKTDSLKSVIKSLSKSYGLFDYYLQVEQMSRSFYRSIPDNKINNFNSELTKLSEKGSDFLELTEEFKSNLAEAIRFKNILDEEKSRLRANVSYIKIVSSPNLPSEKDSPKRTVMIILVSFIFFSLSVLYLILKEKFKSIKNAITEE